MAPPENIKKDDYLIVLDDDSNIAPIISVWTQLPCHPFATVGGLLKAAVNYRPLAAFIDVNLGSGAWGLDAIAPVRKIWTDTAIFIMTSDQNEALIDLALEAGAHDFLTKPLKKLELRARFFRRIKDLDDEASKSRLAVGDIVIDTSRRTVAGPAGARQLTQSECEILSRLAKSKGDPVSRDALKHLCWGSLAVTDTALERKIFNIRLAVADVSAQINVQTVYGVGYCLNSVDTTEKSLKNMSGDKKNQNLKRSS